MIFGIDRASSSMSDNKKPCKGCRKKANGWVIEIKTLKHLLKIVKQEGDIVISSDNDIIIYDDYLE